MSTVLQVSMLVSYWTGPWWGLVMIQTILIALISATIDHIVICQINVLNLSLGMIVESIFFRLEVAHPCSVEWTHSVCILWDIELSGQAMLQKIKKANKTLKKQHVVIEGAFQKLSSGAVDGSQERGCCFIFSGLSAWLLVTTAFCTRSHISWTWFLVTRVVTKIVPLYCVVYHTNK